MLYLVAMTFAFLLFCHDFPIFIPKTTHKLAGGHGISVLETAE